MNKPKIQAQRPDTDNPAWSKDDFARAQPASAVLPGLFSPARTQALLKPRLKDDPDQPQAPASAR